MAFCSNCGAQIADGAAFCSNCGTPAQMQAAPGAVTQAAEEVQQTATEWTQQAPEEVQQAADGFAQQAAEEVQQAADSFAEQPAMSFGGDMPQAPAFEQPAMQMAQDAAQQQAWQQGQDYAQAGGAAPYAAGGAYAMPEKKSKKGLIIGLSIGGAVLLIGIILLILFLTGVIGGGAKGPQAFVGDWKFDSMEAYGIKITAETFTAMGLGDASEVAEMSVVITEDAKVTMNVMGMEQSMQGQFNGDKLTVSQAGQSIDFVIEDGKLVFAMDESGIEAKMTFVKR